jgi:predicted metal-dependent peptidase
MNPNKTPKELVEFALTRMIIKTPFFGTLACKLVLKESSDVATFKTDGKSIKYNPEFVKLLNPRQLATALAEAVMYCILHHPTRRQNRDPQKYGASCRHEVDEYLLKDNAVDMQRSKINPWDWPEFAPPLYDEALKGLVAEQIYNRIPDSGGGPGDGTGKGNLCEVEDPEIEDQAEAQEQEAKWDIAVEQAATIAKARGDLPQHLEQFLKDAKPKLPWTHHLKPFVRQFSKEDYSFTRPNMGVFMATDGEVILPSLWSEGLGNIVVVVDSSGSIACDKALLGEFTAEIASIHRECSPKELHFMDCDAAVHAHRVYGPQDQLDLTTHGGGGTDFRPVFERVAEERIEPVCLLYFTDMWGTFPKDPPPYPVLWISYSDTTTAPFGTVINAK